MSDGNGGGMEWMKSEHPLNLTRPLQREVRWEPLGGFGPNLGRSSDGSDG